MQITTLPQALERIDFLEATVDGLKRELGYIADEGALVRVTARWALTGKEAALLLHLYERRGSFATKASVMTALYAGRDEPEIKIVDVFVCKLRDKIGADLIETVWGQGYRLGPAGAAAVETVLAMPLGDIRRSLPATRDQVRPDRGVLQARMLKNLATVGPSDIWALRRKLAGTFNGSQVANMLSAARATGRVRVADWKQGADGLRRSVYEITDEGHAYVRRHASALSEIPA